MLSILQLRKKIALRSYDKSRIIIHSKYYSLFDWNKSHGQFFITSYRCPNLEDVCEIRKMTTIVKGDGQKKGRQPEKPVVVVETEN